ncbi:MAG: Asp-tRNA(Asn)/Glu-tRNA(Gln) amidotransferase subunit GatA [Planctomycetota bacterium]|nr:Asp-tRNA(Asn)/Glu-tRNA(Gln) amidotransferase subunit GatA [Planctomycetota bacterium]
MSAPREAQEDHTPDGHDLRAAILAGTRSAADVVGESLERIEAANEKLQAFYAVDREGAARRAAKLDAKLAAGGEPGPLFGLPVALKGNMCLEGAESNCGSRILAGYRAPYTATFVRRLLEADAVVCGMTHMDEFAMGSSGENSAYAAAKNPWDPRRTPGGSSSGSAAAVAAGLVPLALGSDTGGSVRQPAALCGISGFKPTYGRVSRYGLIAFGSSLDQVSPLARSVRDLELVASLITGADPMDSTCLNEPPVRPRRPETDASLDGIRVGVPEEYMPESLDAGVRERVERSVEKLAELGADVVSVRLPHTDYAIATYYVVATAEASSNLARYEGVRYGLRVPGDGSLMGMFAATRDAGFGDEVKRRILLGTYVLSSGYYEAWYGRALKVRGLIAADFAKAFEDVDLIVGPTSPTPAFLLGERTGDPVAMYLSDVLTAPVSLAGLPAASVPCGFVEAEDAETGGVALPVGLQIVGPRRADAEVLRAARVFQEATDHHLRTPGPAGPGIET